MADDADRAQQIMEQRLDDALAAHKRLPAYTVADSALICIDCERPIPAQRREAAPGCTRCVPCQKIYENWRPL